MNKIIYAIALTLTVLGGCGKIKNYATLNDAPPGRVIAISLFKCNCDPLIRETVQDTLVDDFFQYTNAKPVKGENGDITIVGIITMDEGHTGTIKGSSFGSAYSGTAVMGGGSSGSSASGNYVTGITVQAYKNGVLIASHSEGQNLGRGTLAAAVTTAKRAARRISSALISQNEIGRK